MAKLKHMGGLTSLNLAGCDKVTDEGLQVLKHTPHLTSLDLDMCRNVTDKGLEALKHTPNLVSLELEECGVTDEGLKELSTPPSSPP